MLDTRKAISNASLRVKHGRAFMNGWLDAAIGKRYEAVGRLKTDANIGNLLGWILGAESPRFRERSWNRYLKIALAGPDEQRVEELPK